MVDDHEPMRFLWKTVLNQLGIESEQAENGQAAVDLIKQGERYRLILMDIAMPIMTGIEATTAIREYEKAQGLAPLLIVAVTSGAATKRTCLKAGMNDYFEKPSRIEDLRAIVETAAPDLFGSNEKPEPPKQSLRK